MRKFQFRVVISKGCDEPKAIFSGLEGFRLVTVLQMPMMLSQMQASPQIYTVFYLEKDITDDPETIKILEEQKAKYEQAAMDQAELARRAGIELVKDKTN